LLNRLTKEAILFTLVFSPFASVYDVDGDRHEGLAEAIYALQVVAGQTPSSSDPTGNAQPYQVLEGITFSNVNVSGVTGTMPDNGTLTITPGISDQTIAEGYHSGAGVVSGVADLLSNNIKSGITLYGVVGDPMVVDTSEGEAVAADIKVDRRVYVDGAKVTGTNHGPWGCVAQGAWDVVQCYDNCRFVGVPPHMTCLYGCFEMRDNTELQPVAKVTMFFKRTAVHDRYSAT
jgi:hypothetical protein